MHERKMVFRVLAFLPKGYYKSDQRQGRFPSLCHDTDMQRLTFEAAMNKKLVRARPMAPLQTGLNNIAHLARLVPAGVA